jgi:hypothetical protein
MLESACASQIVRRRLEVACSALQVALAGYSQCTTAATATPIVMSVSTGTMSAAMISFVSVIGTPIGAVKRLMMQIAFRLASRPQMD